MSRGIPHDMIRSDTPLYGAQQEAPRTIDFLPYVFPPENFVPFDVVDLQTVGAASTVTVTIFNATNAYAVIRWFANETTTATDISNIRWTILVGGTAYQPYNAMVLSRGTVDNPDPIIIRVRPNVAVTVNIQNVGGVGIETRTRVKGWFY